MCLLTISFRPKLSMMITMSQNIMERMLRQFLSAIGMNHTALSLTWYSMELKTIIGLTIR